LTESKPPGPSEEKPNSPKSEQPSHQGGLRRIALVAALWRVFQAGGQTFIRFVSSIVLAHLLAPSDFGINAQVAVLIMLIEMMGDMGFGGSVVRSKRGDDPDFLATAWTLQVLRGLVMAIIIAAAAWPAALWYDSPILLQLIPAAALGSVLRGCRSSVLMSFRKHLNQRPLIVLSMSAQVVSTLATIGFAAATGSVWSLVLGPLVGSLYDMLASHLFYGLHIPLKFKLEPSAAKEILGFGVWIWISTIFMFFATRGEVFLLGRLVSDHMLGVYAYATTLAMIPTQLTMQMGRFVIFPAYSKVKDRPEGMAKQFRESRGFVLMLGALVVSLLVCASPSLVMTMYPPPFWQASWIAAMLGVGTWFMLMGACNGAALLALGAPKWVACSDLVKLIGMVILLPLGFHHYGLVGAIGGLLLAEGLRYMGMIIITRRFNLPMMYEDLLLTLGIMGTALVGQKIDSTLIDQGIAAPWRACIMVSYVCLLWAWPTFQAMKKLKKSR